VIGAFVILERKFTNPVYVKIRRNAFELRHVDSGQRCQVTSSQPFSTKRLLIGEVLVAETYLLEAVKGMFRKQWFRPAPVLVMHPLEMIEGGLSSVEERVLLELAEAVGGRQGVVWIGEELTDEQAKSVASGS